MAAVTITKPPTNVNHQPQARSEPGGGASARVERSTADPQLSVTTIPGQDLRVSGPTAASARTAASVASHPSWDPSCPLRRTGSSEAPVHVSMAKASAATKAPRPLRPRPPARSPSARHRARLPARNWHRCPTCRNPKRRFDQGRLATTLITWSRSARAKSAKGAGDRWRAAGLGATWGRIAGPSYWAEGHGPGGSGGCA